MSYIQPPVAGGSGSGNFAQVLVDFGFGSAQEGDVASATISATWVTPTSIILCNPAAVPTTDHDEQDAQVEGLVAYAGNLIPGVSFDVLAYAPQGTWGKYLINAQGA